MALHPKIIDLTLERVERLLARLGHPERDLPPAIHVAGTNGKGSTLAMIRAGLESAGRSCHVYTSPHLARFHERIRVAGRLISEPDLLALLEECERVNAGAPITFFEITTCAAFLAFARSPADYALIEVGLGGRLDATNVISRPALTAITPISLDHQQYLGETLAQIAAEKAGILKPGIPCVLAPQPDQARAVVEERAARLGAPLLIGGQDWDSREEAGRLVYQDADGLLDLPLPALAGAHQIVNAGAAVAALRALGMNEAACAGAMTGARWPARMQRLDPADLPGAPPDAEIWLDGGHNPAAGQALAALLARMNARRSAPLHLVCGMLDTKDPEGFLGHFAPLAPMVHAVSIPDAPATLPAERTAAAARAVGLRAEAAGDLGSALAAVARAGDPAPRVVICGSLYLAGAVLRTMPPLD
ncbi:bifunctional folylpolyglutamate synthase/dihydrofolate synthase [Oceanicella actignis]|uniref:bifunctional folylpolyglutamate synthase/dihydrofolate synthase n=1 Tax=Oceanicella actignis TaxID=1189325 RepID=UPI0011E899CB|nr:folylpolyglutamate synthase/dihydrofolate synthase family protein [Oceanicella actignis]TYO84855.1 dihydrofolate synthase/folylpolyglutamate synthase [Oceanicella actignis]